MSRKNNQRSNRDENCTNPAAADDDDDENDEDDDDDDDEDEDEDDEDDDDDADDDYDETMIYSHQAVSIASPLSPGFAVK